MNYKIELTPKAQKELSKAWNWYEEQQYGLGSRFEKDFFKKAEFIRKDPFIYQLKISINEIIIGKLYRMSSRSW